jgi:hypothetical protein
MPQKAHKVTGLPSLPARLTNSFRHRFHFIVGRIINSFAPVLFGGMHSPEPDKHFSGKGGSGFFAAGSFCYPEMNSSAVRVGSIGNPGSLLEDPSEVRGAGLGYMSVVNGIGGLICAGSKPAVAGELFRVVKPGDSACFSVDGGRGEYTHSRGGHKPLDILMNFRERFNLKLKFPLSSLNLSFCKEKLIGKVKPSFPVHFMKPVPVGIEVGDGSFSGEIPGACEIGSETDPLHGGFCPGGSSCKVMSVAESLSERIKRFTKYKALWKFFPVKNLGDVPCILEVGFKSLPGILHGFKSCCIDKMKSFNFAFKEEPEPSIESNGFKSAGDRLRPFIDKLRDLIPVFGGDSSCFKFHPAVVEDAESKGILVKVDAYGSVGHFMSPFMLQIGAVKLFSTTGQLCPNFGR